MDGESRKESEGDRASQVHIQLTRTMTEKEAIEAYEEALSGICDRLNDGLIQMLGEGADWSNHVGSVNVPLEYGLQPDDYIRQIWAAREEANSALQSVQQDMEGS